MHFLHVSLFAFAFRKGELGSNNYTFSLIIISLSLSLFFPFSPFLENLDSWERVESVGG